MTGLAILLVGITAIGGMLTLLAERARRREQRNEKH